jgi:hypothetical protein
MVSTASRGSRGWQLPSEGCRPPPAFRRPESVAGVARVSAPSLQADDDESDEEEEQQESHGRKFAPTNMLPRVAEMTLHIDFLPTAG